MGNYSFWDKGSHGAAISMWDLVAAGHPWTEEAGALAWSRAVFLMVSPRVSLGRSAPFHLVSTQLTHSNAFAWCLSHAL